MIQDLLKELDYESWEHEYAFWDWCAQWDWCQLNDPSTDMDMRLHVMWYPWYNSDM